MDPADVNNILQILLLERDNVTQEAIEDTIFTQQKIIKFQN